MSAGKRGRLKRNRHPATGELSPVVVRRNHLQRHLWIGLAIVVGFAGLKLALSHTATGHWLHLQSYLWMHSLAGRPPRDAPLPLLVVDIGDLKPEPAESNESGPAFTPRNKLAELLQEMARGSAGDQPIAIGVYIDLSPETNGFVAPGSFELFDTCLAITQSGTPIHLGVRRMEALGTASWLGHPRYAPLAASISRPRGLVTQMPLDYQFGMEGFPLKSLSAALADDWRMANPAQSRAGWDWFTRDLISENPVESVPDFRIRKFHVDFKHLSILRTNAIKHAELLALEPSARAALVCGRMVMLGDVSSAQAEDAAIIPGQPEPVPGVFTHAAAAITLAEGRWRELRWWVGLGLSVLISLSALYLIHSLCWRYAKAGEVTSIPLNLLLTPISMGLILALGWGLMRQWQVMWLEVFAVCLVLLLHILAELLITAVNWEGLRMKRIDLGTVLVQAPSPTKHDKRH